MNYNLGLNYDLVVRDYLVPIGCLAMHVNLVLSYCLGMCHCLDLAVHDYLVVTCHNTVHDQMGLND